MEDSSSSEVKRGFFNGGNGLSASEFRKKKTGGLNQKDIKKILIDFPEKISVSFLDRIQIILIENTSDNGLHEFGEIREYALINGHTNPGLSNPSLGYWVKTQSGEYKKGKLSKERIELLENIGISCDPIEEYWQNKYQKLKEYALVNGHANPPHRSSSLGIWVGAQRTAYNKNQLSQERIGILESIEGWVWQIK